MSRGSGSVLNDHFLPSLFRVFSALAWHCSDSWDPLFTSLDDSHRAGYKE